MKNDRSICTVCNKKISTKEWVSGLDAFCKCKPVASARWAAWLSPWAKDSLKKPEEVHLKVSFVSSANNEKSNEKSEDLDSVQGEDTVLWGFSHCPFTEEQATRAINLTGNDRFQYSKKIIDDRIYSILNSYKEYFQNHNIGQVSYDVMMMLRLRHIEMTVARIMESQLTLLLQSNRLLVKYEMALSKRVNVATIKYLGAWLGIATFIVIVMQSILYLIK